MQRFFITITLLALLALSGCRAAFYFDRGVAHVEHGRYVKAIAAFDNTIRLQPHNADAYYNRGVAHYTIGWYGRAIADFDEAIRLQPDNADAYFNRGNAYYDFGRYAESHRRLR